MHLINLTPHTIHLIVNSKVVSVPPSGVVARVQMTTTVVSRIDDGIPLVRSSPGNVIDLPEPCEGTLFLVSALVRVACPNRSDIASPGDLVRDAEGLVVGCKTLIVN